MALKLWLIHNISYCRKFDVFFGWRKPILLLERVRDDFLLGTFTVTHFKMQFLRCLNYCGSSQSFFQKLAWVCSRYKTDLKFKPFLRLIHAILFKCLLWIPNKNLLNWSPSWLNTTLFEIIISFFIIIIIISDKKTSTP